VTKLLQRMREQLPHGPRRAIPSYWYRKVGEACVVRAAREHACFRTGRLAVTGSESLMTEAATCSSNASSSPPAFRIIPGMPVPAAGHHLATLVGTLVYAWTA
jgi:hypothetical protein